MISTTTDSQFLIITSNKTMDMNSSNNTRILINNIRSNTNSKKFLNYRTVLGNIKLKHLFSSQLRFQIEWPKITSSKLNNKLHLLRIVVATV